MTRIAYVIFFVCLVFAIGCGKTPASSRNDGGANSRESNAEELKAARAKTKKAEEELKKAQEAARAKTKKAEEELKKAQSDLEKAKGEEKARLEEKIAEIAREMAESDKVLKDASIQAIQSSLQFIKTADENKRKQEYLALTQGKSPHPVVRSFFEEGKEPEKNDLIGLDQEQLRNIQADLDTIMRALL